MTLSLLEKLRKNAGSRPGTHLVSVHTALLAAAADEIERLQARVSDLTWQKYPESGY